MDNVVVRLERMGDVGVILVDHKPVNALSQAVRKGLIAALETVVAEPALHAAVIAAEGRTFIAGADIGEFDKGPAEVTTQDIVRALDTSPKPVVAAIHGTALGGGFEVALACHARVIAPDGFVGLPEVRIGIIPGAGGTQRLPRLVGPLVALDMVSTGRHVPADEAMTLGLVDEVATDVRRAAVARARHMAEGGHLPRVTDRVMPAYDRAAFDVAAATVKRRARGAIAPLRAVAAIEAALRLPVAEGMAVEAEINQELRTSPQSRALRHLFRAERAAARMPPNATPWPVRRVGVIGGGTMGSGIAVALADAGLEVTLVEVSETAAAAAETRVRAVYDRQLKSGRLTQQVYTERRNRIVFRHELRALRDTDLVIEAVIEDLEAKRKIFRALSPIVRRDTVLASNTSYLDINLLADEVDAPERVIGTHFFSPAHVMRLLELYAAACAARGSGNRAGAGAPAAQGRGGGRRVRWFHRQPVVHTLAAALRVRAGGWRAAGRGRRGAGGVWFRDGAVRRAGHGGTGHRLDGAQAPCADARSAPAAFTGV